MFRPWIPEPGGWLQFDWGAGPTIAGRATSLFCAWLAWSRFRVVIACWDRTEPTLIACLDATFRALGGAPTHVLTDNEKTVTVGHVAGIAVRNPDLVAAGRYYGVSVQTCVVADPQSKGGSEATVRVAKADLVPTDANLLDDYAAFADLKAACELFTEQVNARPHRLLGRPPVEALAEEHVHLHPIPALPHVATFGTTRTVSRDSTISFGGVRYSVPHRLIDTRVWVREHGDELVVVTVDSAHGPAEAARHAKSTKGHPRIIDAHYPPRSSVPASKTPRARDPHEQAFLDLGDGARSWLIEAAACGAHRVRAKLAKRSSWPAWSAPSPSTAPLAPPRWLAASATATWPRCWTTNATAATPHPCSPAVTRACSKDCRAGSSWDNDPPRYHRHRRDRTHRGRHPRPAAHPRRRRAADPTAAAAVPTRRRR